jgi:hypothetical protein
MTTTLSLTLWGKRTRQWLSSMPRGADLKRKMRGVVTDFEAEVNRRRTGIVKPT